VTERPAVRRRGRCSLSLLLSSLELSAAKVSNTSPPGQAAGPLLYAATLFPELQDVAQRGFTSFAEVLHAKSLIDRCDAVHGMRRLAQYHARLALDALESLPESEARPNPKPFFNNLNLIKFDDPEPETRNPNPKPYTLHPKPKPLKQARSSLALMVHYARESAQPR